MNVIANLIDLDDWSVEVSRALHLERSSIGRR